MAARPSPLPIAAPPSNDPADWADVAPVVAAPIQAQQTQNAAKAPSDWFDVTPGGGGTGSPTPSQSPKPTLPLSLPQMMRGTAIDFLPTIGATAATALVPEAGIPLRMAMAALGGAGGSTAQQAMQKAGGLPGAPQSGSEFLQRTGTDAVVQAGGELGGQLISKTLASVLKRFTPSQMYQSALMPPPGKGTAKIGQMVGSGIENNIPVSAEGQEAAHQLWQDLNKQIEAQIAADPKKVIDPKTILSGLNDLRHKWLAGSGDPAYLNAINEVEQNFKLRHPVLTSESAQAAKKGIYNEIRLSKEGAWGSPKPNQLDVQAKQDIAGALKQELERLYPGIGPINAKEGAAIELDRAIDHQIAKEGNKRLSPYFTLISSIGSLGGGFASGHTDAGMGAAAGMMGIHLLRSMLEDPEVKSKLAIALAKASQSKVIKVGQLAGKYLSPTQTAVRGAGNLAQNVLAPPPSQ